MNGYKEDTDHSYRTGLFLILFLLLSMAYSTNAGNHNSPKADSLDYLKCGDISYRNAILCNSVSFFHLQKCSESDWYKAISSFFSIPDKVQEYNRKIALNLICIRKTRLSKGPVFHLKLYFHHPDNKDEIPVLS